MKYYLYTHIGSGNRGCEATAHSLSVILGSEKKDICVFSEDKIEEQDCHTENYATVKYTPVVSGLRPFSSIIPRCFTKFGVDPLASVKYRYKKMFNEVKSDSIGLSTGGDVFCYNQNLANKIGYLTKKMKERGCKNYLIACSIEQTHLTKQSIEILKMFDYIFPRESITEENLRAIGFENVKRYPDPAFALPIEPVSDIKLDDKIDYIGINYSRYTNQGEKTEERFQMLVKFIDNLVKSKSTGVILIPHVFWQIENDLNLLKKIKEQFKNNNRVILIDKHYNSSQMKYIISKCRFFIGSRTHSVIGAYSSGVPALAIGYSIKSKGIAKDIFGEFAHYVFDSHNLGDYEAFSKAFQYIVDHETEIRYTLNEKNKSFSKELKEQAQYLKRMVE